jgi:hypothetical protein
VSGILGNRYQTNHEVIEECFLSGISGRMDTNRIPKQALQYKPKGRRNIGNTGRRRKRWRDQLHLEVEGRENTPNPS